MKKTYTLNEYFPNMDTTATRAEIYCGNTTAANLLTYHKKNKAMEVSVWECIGDDVSNLPMPNVVMSMLDGKIKAINKRIVVTGIDAYLSLLSKRNIKAFMTALHSRIDEGKLNAAYMLSKTRFEDIKFSNPKFQDSFLVVYICGDELPPVQPTFIVISDRWVNRANHLTSWNSLLKQLGQHEPTGSYTLVLSNYKSKQAGLSDSVIQLFDINEIAERYYGISINLPKNVVEMLVEKCKEDDCSPAEYLKAKFGESNINTRLAIKRLLELENDELWPAYIWFLQRVICRDSYLWRVLSADIDKNNILRKYVFEIAGYLYNESNATNFASERAQAIKEVGTIADSLIIEFIDTMKEKASEDIACWLNCDTAAEHIEIVRRISESDLTVGLPQMWSGRYPLLEDYLSDQYDYGCEKLTAYFWDYRRFKITNTVTEAFVKEAFDIVLPSHFSNRDYVLQDLSIDNKTALLIVDGMGAEYCPLIIAMAKRRGMYIEDANISAVRLPSSTKFNLLHWDAARILKPEIHEVDNISHYGAEKNGGCSFEQNIVAALDVFETVISRVANGLRDYERVVVTADHGSSRLAVITHEKGLDKTLPWSASPLDWRYSVAPPDTERPPEFESYYNIDENITYWIVRGYNRLPKKGGKLSVHGGATLEERLVPIIVFSKMKTEIKSTLSQRQNTQQLVEKKGFDI